MSSLGITGSIVEVPSSSGSTDTVSPLIKLNGEAIIERQIRKMREVCGEIILVTNTPKPFFTVVPPSVRIITEYFTDSGALGGMHAALHLSRQSTVWITGNGMPFISPEAARRLAERLTEGYDAVLPIIRNQPVPLHGLYDKKCADAAARLLARGERGLEAFLAEIRWIGIPADEWTNEDSIGIFDYKVSS